MSHRANQRRSGSPSYRGCPSFLRYRWWLATAALAVVGGYFGARIDGWYGFGGVVLFTLIITGVAFDRSSRIYLVTPRRVEHIFGLLGKSSREIRIEDIRAINVRKQGLLGLLGIGQVDFSSSGSDGVDVSFRDVWRPHRIKTLVRKLQDSKD